MTYKSISARSTGQSKIKKGLWGLFSLLLSAGAVSCSDNAVGGEDTPEEPISYPAAYFSLKVSTSPTTRSRALTEEEGDSNKGTVPGNDPENKVESATIYLVDPSSNTIALQLDARRDIAAVNSESETDVVAEIDDIEKLYALRGKTFKIFVVANAEVDFTPYFSHNFSNEGTGNRTNPKDATFPTSSWGSPIGDFGINGKVMPLANYNDEITITIPTGASKEAALAEIYKKFDRISGGEAYWDVKEDNSDKPLYLERGVARVEYQDFLNRDSSVTDENQNADVDNKKNTDLAANRYWLGDMDVVLQLYSIQPFNLSTESYLFRHTAPGNFATAGSTVDLFGYERGSNADAYNWIASPWWTTGTPSLLNPLTITKTNYFIGDEENASSHGITLVETFQSRSNADNDGYHPLFYIPENTLKSTSQMVDYTGSDDNKVYQLTKHATGIAFKFIVLANDYKSILEYEEQDESDDEGAEGNESQTETVTSNYPDAVTNSTTEGQDKWITITDPVTTKWVDAKPEIVIINGEKKTAYTLTYITCLIHNDGDVKDDVTGFAPMYYSVVRNNTYQVSVNSIVGLPLPQDPKTLFLRVQCKVKNWNVRYDDDVTLY